MKLRWKLGIGIPAALLVAGVLCWFTIPYFPLWVWVAYQSVRPIPHVCKQRAADFQAREQRIRLDAESSLKPGTKKSDVIRFFESEKIPVDFYRIAGHNIAQGQIYVQGLPECANAACGDDAAMMGLRVDLDQDGTVVSKPDIVGMYMNCL